MFKKMFGHKMVIALIPLVWCLSVDCAQENSYVKNLVGEPDYRKVKLHWESEQFNVPLFQIRYCELQSWGTQRCRTKMVDDGAATHDYDNINVFSTEVTGLRMATTYSFEVKAKQGLREERADDSDHEEYRNVIVIPTKGFSARATQCLPHASEIEVSTGPHFAGRIAVEAADGERCAIDGEPDSARDTYTLRINHSECGSSVNETTVATFVIVQENLPILTHSTRRFLVLCTYQPETLTVRAGINLPTHRGQAKVSPVEEENQVRHEKRPNGRTGRLLQKPQALARKEETKGTDFESATTKSPVVILGVLCLLIGSTIAVVELFRINLKRNKQQPHVTLA